jgi:hypothetical protein
MCPAAVANQPQRRANTHMEYNRRRCAAAHALIARFAVL